jgi:hypothetical protein
LEAALLFISEAALLCISEAALLLPRGFNLAVKHSFFGFFFRRAERGPRHRHIRVQVIVLTADDHFG